MDERDTDARRIAEEAIGERPEVAIPDAAKQNVIKRPEDLAVSAGTSGKPCHPDCGGCWRAGGRCVRGWHHRRGAKAVAGNCSAEILSGTSHPVATSPIGQPAAHCDLGIRLRLHRLVSDPSPPVTEVADRNTAIEQTIRVASGGRRAGSNQTRFPATSTALACPSLRPKHRPLTYSTSTTKRPRSAGRARVDNPTCKRFSRISTLSFIGGRRPRRAMDRHIPACGTRRHGSVFVSGNVRLAELFGYGIDEDRAGCTALRELSAPLLRWNRARGFLSHRGIGSPRPRGDVVRQRRFGDLGEFASRCRRALRLDPDCQDPLVYHLIMLDRVRERADEFDIMHFHTDYLHFPLFADMLD